jgi:hypothetical protein
VSTFRIEMEIVHNAGFTYFDQLGGREVEDGLEIWLRVMDPTTSEVRLIKTLISSADDLVSVADLWPGAAWAEAEIRSDFCRESRVAFRRAADDLPGETVGGYTSSGVPAHAEEPK